MIMMKYMLNYVTVKAAIIAGYKGYLSLSGVLFKI
jgi:hypothetical protein